MPTIDQIIQDEITRNAKREIRAAVAEWLQLEASEAVVAQVKTAIQPFLVMMNDQRKVIEALRAQLEVASQPLSRSVPGAPRKNSKSAAIKFPPNEAVHAWPGIAKSCSYGGHSERGCSITAHAAASKGEGLQERSGIRGVYSAPGRMVLPE